MEILDAFDEGEFDDFAALTDQDDNAKQSASHSHKHHEHVERTVEEDEFILHNSFVVNILYRNYITQEILYSDDFSFWTLLTEVGGALGLYFGVTVITVYETMFFFFTVREVKPVREKDLDKKLTKKILYLKENNTQDLAKLPMPLNL
ncbi:unnamed protein product [Bursaphelenchus okinawaensis]|uniref:Uncharacterized protein n=1 Tax=Bursaphelenchus okinawaensis TaxID=465554 RepID=A0A811JRM0_9BILA|nr:unnamed protein product [Bursaphelenchus okinawaensis]CAG9079236.1 unnamed protein product [Bursaphelenchus okinawaensis]